MPGVQPVTWLLNGALSAFVEERERWMLWVPVLLGIGILIYFACKSEPPLWSGVLPTLVLGCALLAVVWRASPAADVASLIIAAALAISLGLTVAQLRSRIVASPMLKERVGPTTVIGEVEQSEAFPVGARLTLANLRIQGMRPELTPERARLRLMESSPSFRPGQTLRLRAVLNPLAPPAAPGAFDFQRYGYFQGLGAVGFVMGRPEIVADAGDDQFFSWGERVRRLRLAIAESVRQYNNEASGAIIVALLVGEVTSIPEPVLQAIRDAGLAHLLSISGLHIGMVAGILFFWTRLAISAVPYIALRLNAKKLSALVAIAGAGFYTLLAGALVPTQRSFFMIAILMLAIVFDRRALSKRLLAWAAIFILLLQPEALLGASFQMSFAAMITLIAGYEAWEDQHSASRPQPLTRVARYLASIVLSSLIATIATTPFAIFHFNRFALLGTITNLAAIPLTGFWIMPWGVLVLVLLPFGFEGWALEPMGWGTQLLIELSQWAAAIPAGTLIVPVLPEWGLLLIASGGLWLCLWRTRWRFAGLALVAAGYLSIGSYIPPDLLISSSGTLAAVRLENGQLAFSRKGGSAQLRTAWTERLGNEPHAEVWPESGTLGDTRFRCDREGCVYLRGSRVVALPRSPVALLEDCRRADLVIDARPLGKTCRRTKQIGLWALREGGTHAVWVREIGIRVENVNAERGERPWVLRYEADDADGTLPAGR
jgi:competence protein ComEC